MEKCLPVLFLLAILLSGCSAETQELPPPAELFAAIQADVDLPKMVDTAETDWEALTGIGSDSYSGAVCYRLYEGAAPDEIIIVQGKIMKSPRKPRSFWKNGWNISRNPVGFT